MKTAEDILSDFIPIQSPGTLSDIAKDLDNLVNQGLLLQVSGNYELKDLLVFPLHLPCDVKMIFRTIPGNTTYTMTCETDKGLGGAFFKNG